MKYVNAQTGVEITLKHLTREQKDFYARALELFRRNTSWLAFEEFAFGPRSPLYQNHESHVEVLKDPLYLSLEDMWLQLGVQQGMIKRRGQKDEGRTKSGRGSAEETADREEANNLATTR